jgi:hypothetical protein
MSLLSPDLPRSIEPTRHMRNGMAPSNGAYSHLVAALNHVLAYRKKGIYERESILSETSPAPNNWRFRFRTGFGTVSVEFIAVIGLAIEPAAPLRRLSDGRHRGARGVVDPGWRHLGRAQHGVHLLRHDQRRRQQPFALRA